MAAIAVLSPTFIPGLHQQPTMDDMTKSGDIYNGLPDDADQPQVPSDIIHELKALITKFNVQNKFGLHLVHGHVKLDSGMVMVGKSMHRLPGVWTRPTKAATLDLGALHGHVFVLGADGEFHPYEFRQGPPPPMNANDNAFIAAAEAYLKCNRLTSLIGVELLDQNTIGKQMREFVLSDSDGTVMLPSEAVNQTPDYRTTGWNAVEGITEVKGNESKHSKTTAGNHKVFIDGKALPELENEADAEAIIVDGLREAGVVN